MRVIITGATGTIGSVLMECLPQKYEVIGIARGKAEGTTSLDILKDQEKIKSLVNEGDAVIHLAYDKDDPEDRKNEQMLKTMLDIALEKKAKRFILASSVYVSWRDYRHLGRSGEHEPLQAKILVTNPPNPLTMYGVSKSYFERLGMAYAARGLQVIAARFGNVTSNDEHNAYPFSLSQRDCRQFIEKCLTAKNLPAFSIYFATSNNACNPFDLSNAETELDYHPQDSSPCPLIK